MTTRETVHKAKGSQFIGFSNQYIVTLNVESSDNTKKMFKVFKIIKQQVI